MSRNAAALLLLFVCASPPAFADSPLPGADTPSAPDITRESARRFLESVRRLTDRSPIYESPRITRDGDILIPRVPAPSFAGPASRGGVDGELDL